MYLVNCHRVTLGTEPETSGDNFIIILDPAWYPEGLASIVSYKLESLARVSRSNNYLYQRYIVENAPCIYMSNLSSVNLAEYQVHGANNSDSVCQQVTSRDLVETTQMGES